MSSTTPVLISSDNLSTAWSAVLMHLVKNKGTEIAPLVVSITGFADGTVAEVQEVRDALDKALEDAKEFKINTVANTIFPQSIWNRSNEDRQLLYDAYLHQLPRYAAMERQNRNGTYFSRLIAYDIDAVTGERNKELASAVPENGNQLERIIKNFETGKINEIPHFKPLFLIHQETIQPNHIKASHACSI